ncbi:MAG: PepSY domain-containing protein [Acidimicrobiales bacterium]
MALIVERVRGLSRATKSLLVGIILLAAIALSGTLQADSDVAISSEQATMIAEERLDFEPEQTAVKMVREGIGLEPVWAVSFSIPGTNGEEFDRLLVVEVDATDGKIIRVSGR